MVRSALRKAMWVGRATVFVMGAAVTLALVLGVGTVALAAVPGDPFRLGEVNKMDQITTLIGEVDGAMLQVVNNSDGLNATALDLQVNPKRAPMTVNSGTRVTNLNADRLDNKSAADFYARGGTVADSARLDGMDPADVFTQRTNTYRVQATVTGPGSGGTRYFSDSCDPGDKELGGGDRANNEDDDLLGTFPSAPPTQGWNIWFQDNGSRSLFYVFATFVDFRPLRF
jgi:hypothetical protein